MPRNLIIVGKGKGDYDPKSAAEEEDEEGNVVVRDDQGNINYRLGPNNERIENASNRLLFEQTPSDFDGLNSIRQNIAEFAGTKDLPNLPFLRNHLADTDDFSDSDSDDNLSDKEITKIVKSLDKEIKTLKGQIKRFEFQLENSDSDSIISSHPFQNETMGTALRSFIVKLNKNLRELQKEKEKYRKVTKKSWFK